MVCASNSSNDYTKKYHPLLACRNGNGMMILIGSMYLLTYYRNYLLLLDTIWQTYLKVCERIIVYNLFRLVLMLSDILFTFLGGYLALYLFTRILTFLTLLLLTYLLLIYYLYILIPLFYLLLLPTLLTFSFILFTFYLLYSSNSLLVPASRVF